MKSNLIGISGYAFSGKDTVGNILAKTFGYERMAFADKLRQFASIVNAYIPEAEMHYNDIIASIGYDEAKKKYPGFREYLVKIGQGARDVINIDIWVDSTLPKTTSSEDYITKRICISDVRYNSEAKRIHDLGGTVIMVRRDGCEAANITEGASIPLVEFDKLIENNGTLEELESAISSIVFKILV